MAVNVVYAGGAVVTSASGAMTPVSPGGGGTITVADATGYPASGRFVIKLDKGNASEEKVMIASRSGNVFTVESRGYDDTNAQSHDSPTVELAVGAAELNLIVLHVDDGEADPHATKLLNNARHDITARHVYGGALGTRPTPVPIGTALAAGSGANPAAGDHVHELGAGSIDTASFFAAGVINLAAMGTDSVGSAQIVADAVGNPELADNAVAQANMQDGSVGTLELIDLNVTNAKLAATAVTQSKVSSEAPTAYTPTWNASGVAPAIGNGTLTGSYVKWGRLVFFTMEMVAGTTTTFGTGTYEFGLPVASALGAGAPLAALTIMNNSGTRFVGINIQAGTNQRFRTLERLTLDDIAHDAPFTWGTGDFIQVTGAYFSAA